MTQEEIITEFNRLSVEQRKLLNRLNTIRGNKADLVMLLHGLVAGKTVVRATAGAPASSFGKEYVVMSIADDAPTISLKVKPWIIGALTTRYGTSKSAKHVCLKTNWEIVTAEELAREFA